MPEVSPRNYIGTETTARKTEIAREYEYLAKAATELAMTCESLETAFAPVLRQELGKMGVEQTEKEILHTDHGNNLSQVRATIENTTRQVRGLIERKEI